jgi:hypothetical protein
MLRYETFPVSQGLTDESFSVNDEELWIPKKRNGDGDESREEEKTATR